MGRTSVIQPPLRVNGVLEMRVIAPNGSTRRLWNENGLGHWLRSVFHLDLQGWFFLGSWGYNLTVKNLVPTTGKAGAASRLNGAGGEAAFTFIAVGTGTTAPAAGDTTLQAEIVDSGLARAAATASRVTTTTANDTAQLDKTFSVTGTKAVTEAATLNAASAGTMLGRQTFSAINVISGDSLQITHKFVVS